MKLDGIMPSKISQSEKDKIPYILMCMWNLKNNIINKHKRNRLMDTDNKLLVARGQGR